MNNTPCLCLSNITTQSVPCQVPESSGSVSPKAFLKHFFSQKGRLSLVDAMLDLHKVNTMLKSVSAAPS